MMALSRFLLAVLGGVASATAASVARASLLPHMSVPRVGHIPATQAPPLRQGLARVGHRLVVMTDATLGGRRAAEIEGLRDQVEQLRYDGLDIHLTVVREIEAEISTLELDDAIERFESSAVAWRRSSFAGTAELAASLVAVLAAWRTCVLLHAASFYASKGASFASQLTEALRTLPGERLSPLVGRFLGRIVIGREYSPWTRGKGGAKGKGLGYSFVRR